MQGQIKKIINLAKKTGDKIIAFDSDNPEEAYVVMNLEDYEKIIEFKNVDIRSLTEDELIDKINRDIAIWKSQNDFYKENNEINIIKESLSASEDENDENKESEESVNSINNYIKRKINRNRWAIPEERKATTDEVIEEDRQYLEEVIL